MNEYTEIKDQNDIKNMMQKFGNFHDSCLVKACIETGYSVDDSLSMSVPFGQECRVKIIFQRQKSECNTIEMCFDQVIRFNFVPAQENYDRIIYSAFFEKKDSIFYWADYSDWKSGEDNSDICWISAKKIIWKIIK